MFRFTRAFFLLLIACAVLAAPAPKDSWDRPVDPNRDCKFDIKDSTVTIEVPGGDHELDPRRNRFNAPRLLRDVEGDFMVRVRVSASLRPSATSSVKGQDSLVAAGLILIASENNCNRLEYGAYRRNGKLSKGFAHRMRGQQIGMKVEFVGWGPTDWKPNEDHIYLRIERKGRELRNLISPDGKEWERHNSAHGASLPNKIKVGIAAYSTSTEPFKVRFDQFKLSRDKEKDK